jgi:hypothetical protein
MRRRFAAPMLIIGCCTTGAIALRVVLPSSTAKSEAKFADRDHDRLPDRWEKRYHLSTHSPSAKGDPDRDRLSNLKEYRGRTNPRRKDTDRDGLTDRQELHRFHTNPRRADTDGDGVHDGAEVRAGTNPHKRDTKTARTGAATTGAMPGTDSPARCAKQTPNVPDGPDRWGGCFPGPSNTGVPAGTTLTAYTGPCNISIPNTVIDTKIVNCDLNIQGPNVTIKNSKVTGVIWLDQDRTGSSGWSMTVQDSEVDAQSVPMPAICCGMYTVKRVDAHGGQTAVQCENNNRWCTVEDSYLHGQSMPSANSHLGGFLSDGSDSIALKHNFIVCDHPAVHGEGCTGDVNLIANFAAIEGANISRNLLGANIDAAYCTYAGRRTDWRYPPHNVAYRDNVFQRGPNRKCAAYGPATSFKEREPTNVWSGNVWDDGTPLAAPSD